MSDAVAATPDIGDAPAIDRRKTWLTRIGLAVLLAALVWAGWYLLFQRGRVHTDNAYVGADTALVTPRVAGAVKELRVSNTMTVKAGDVLVVLDDTDARAELAAAEAALLQARQHFLQARATGSSLAEQVAGSQAGIAQASARLAAAETELARAAEALSRRQGLLGTGAVSAEEISQARSALAAARASRDEARAALITAQAARGSAAGTLAANQVVTAVGSIEADPEVAAATVRVAAARLQLERTTIRAPISGTISQSQIQLGQQLAPGTPIMRIVPVEQAYVDANFKENQLREVRIGQPAELTSDIYGSGVTYHGKVIGIGAATGAASALIPAQNATGNWVKVVQRLPVRIALDPKELRDHPLRVGMTMDAVIDTRGQ